MVPLMISDHLWYHSSQISSQNVWSKPVAVFYIFLGSVHFCFYLTSRACEDHQISRQESAKCKTEIKRYGL